MTKKIFICFILFTSIITFIMAENYYRSNSIGMVYEQIPFYRIDEFDWIVEIHKEESLEIRKIYFKGELFKWVEYLKKNNNILIKKYEGDSLISIEQRENDLITKEEFYEENILTREYHYEWVERKLLKTTYYEKNILIYVDTFVLGDDGQISQIRRLFENSNLSISGFSNSNKNNSFEWYGSKNDFILYNYKNGRVVKIENWKHGILNRSKIFTFMDTGHSVVETDLANGEINVKNYDLNDNIILETISTGNIFKKIIYNYDNELLIQKDIASSGVRLSYLYEYNNENSLILERILKDDSIIKEIFYDNNKKILEKLYKDNSLLLIVTYENGEKISEENVK